MSTHTLFLLKPGFEDPNIPGVTFFCPSCIFVEGLLAAYPQLLDTVQVERVGFARPRDAVIRVAGEENQGLPLLVIEGISQSAHITGTHERRSLVSGKDAIAAYFAERFGIDVTH